MTFATRLCRKANVFAVIGTSLQVYPAAGLTAYVPKETIRYVVDVNVPYMSGSAHLRKIEHPATIGVPMMVEELLARI